MDIEQPESLRDTISASLDQVESGTPAPVETPIEETQEQKAGRTANRLRDEAGRLLPGTKEVAAPATPSNQVATGTEPPLVAPVAATPINRPQSWKKEYWEKFDKIATEDPQLADYLHQREREFASGVSTYKSEAENARHLNEAIAPFLPNLQKHGLEPTQWIRNLGQAHERLALGSPQEKVMMGAKLIMDYGIDPQALFQALSNPQSIQQPQLNQQDIATAIQRQVDQVLTSREIQSAYQQFVNAKDDSGNPKYPHVEAVKETMAGLLQAELAQDYPSAYEAALRHPRHNDLFQAMQEQQRQQEETLRLAKNREVVTKARAQAVSVKSSTPSGQVPVNGTNSLRETLSSAFDAADGRV